MTPEDFAVGFAIFMTIVGYFARRLIAKISGNGFFVYTVCTLVLFGLLIYIKYRTSTSDYEAWPKLGVILLLIPLVVFGSIRLFYAHREYDKHLTETVLPELRRLAEEQKTTLTTEDKTEAKIEELLKANKR